MLMGWGVKIMGLIDIIAALILILGDFWIGIHILGWALLIKGLISIVS